MTTTKYGLEAVKPGTESREYETVCVYKVEEEDDGSVFISEIGWFRDRQTAHAFCRAWNGEAGPKP